MPAGEAASANIHYISLFMKGVALYKKYGARRKKEKQLEHSEISFQRFLKPFLNK